MTSIASYEVHACDGIWILVAVAWPRAWIHSDTIYFFVKLINKYKFSIACNSGINNFEIIPPTNRCVCDGACSSHAHVN